MFATAICAAEVEDARRLAAVASRVCREYQYRRGTEEEADSAIAARQAAVAHAQAVFDAAWPAYFAGMRQESRAAGFFLQAFVDSADGQLC